MGSFFSNITFERNGRSEDQLNKIIATALEKAGIDVDDKECFFENSADKRWVTVYCEMFVDMNITEEQIKIIANSLEGFAINIYCVDSDFIDMKASDGNYSGTVYIGEPYFDDAGEPDLKVWESFFENDSDLEKFKDIISDDYICAEDSIEPLAELFGFDKNDVNCFFEEVEERAVTKLTI